MHVTCNAAAELHKLLVSSHSESLQSRSSLADTTFMYEKLRYAVRLADSTSALLASFHRIATESHPEVVFRQLVLEKCTERQKNLPELCQRTEIASENMPI